MPIYEYACKSCDAKFEELVRSMSTEAKIKCPKCGSTKTARALSVFAVSGDGAKSTGSSSTSGHVHSGMCGCGKRAGSCGM